MIDLRAIIRDNIDRKKYLQNSTFIAMRSMRSVFCELLVMVAKVTSNYLWR